MNWKLEKPINHLIVIINHKPIKIEDSYLNVNIIVNSLATKLNEDDSDTEIVMEQKVVGK